MADYFTTFVENLLGNPAPSGPMFSGPFVGSPDAGSFDYNSFLLDQLGRRATQPSPVLGSLSSFVNPDTLMIDRGMMSQDAADYYADPFRLQNEINQRILEEELKNQQKQEMLKQLIVQDGGNYSAPASPFNFAPVDDYSSYGPGGYTGDTGSGTIGNTGVGIDSAAVSAGNEGAGLGAAEGAFGGGVGTGMGADNADSLGGWL